MDAREPSRLVSSENSGILAAPNLYGSGAGDMGHSMVMASSTGMRLPVTSVISSMQNPLEGSVTVYGRDALQGMRPEGMFNMVEPPKKKRGRPKRYGPDGSMSLALCRTSSKSDYSNTPLSDSTAKRRGRPPGSGKKQQLDALGSSGTAFTPHVITVKAGEDVASKIMAFSQQGSRTVCILSANGAICNVTLRQTATSGGTVTYEGRFEIISLSGSYLLTENEGTRSRTGGLSVSLAGSDGRIVGGGVAGMLMAATTVQVVVGSFIEKKTPKPEPLKLEPSPAAPTQIPGFGMPSESSPPSQGSLNESDDEQRSPANHSGGVCNNSSGQHFLGMPPSYSMGWIHSGN